jgi:Putative MetA-pathway of phenol degradation
LNGCNPDFLNADLTATRKFGKWEFGGVGYPIPSYQKQSQFAVGGFFGYDFGRLLCRPMPPPMWWSAITAAWIRVAGSA